MSRHERERAMLERIEVRESPIHGKGVFARRRLRLGQWIGRFEGDETTENGTYVLWLIDEDGSGRDSRSERAALPESWGSSERGVRGR